MIESTTYESKGLDIHVWNCIASLETLMEYFKHSPINTKTVQHNKTT